MTFLNSVHPEWKDALEDVLLKIQEIEESLGKTAYEPKQNLVLRALEHPISHTRVAIFGQDPYPTPGYATGLAFSVSRNVKTLPKSLRNIFQELSSDLGCPTPVHGDLSSWSDQGVALINRVLSVPSGVSNGHKNIGWQAVTNEIARILGERKVVAVLWGNNAQEMTHFFKESWVLASAHPSPLSAHRGFFGSRPFSKTNAILKTHNIKPIDWSY